MYFMTEELPLAGPAAAATGSRTCEFARQPRIAVVVASSADPESLRAWLHPIASLATAWRLEVVVARGAPLPELAAWGASFAGIRVVEATGGAARQYREGARATSADVLFLTHDAEPGACRRLLSLMNALQLERPAAEPPPLNTEPVRNG